MALRKSRQTPVESMTNSVPDSELDAGDGDFKPLTADQAQQWRQRHPAVSVGQVVVMQMVVGAVAASVIGAVTSNLRWGLSAGYGALSVVVPAALFAQGVFRRRTVHRPRAAMARFLGWEIAKILLTVAMLASAPRMVAGLGWLALLAGMVVTLKTYWIALWWRSRSVQTIDTRGKLTDGC